MITNLYTYSMVRAYYNKGKDYIDSFWPFIISMLGENGKPMALPEIQRGIADANQLRIPLHSLKSIALRAKRMGYLTGSRTSWTLTEKGEQYYKGMEEQAAAQRRINHCLSELAAFLTQHNANGVSVEKAGDLMSAFIREHVLYFLQFIAPGTERIHGTEMAVSLKRPMEVALLRFFMDAEQRKPDVFSTLRDMICGSIISTTVESTSLAEIKRRIKKTTVFLDTNLVLSVLGLHFDEYNKPAQELLELLAAEDAFEINVFDFTVDEIVRVLSRYSMNWHGFSPGIHVDSVHSSLRSKGWSPADVRGLIANIEARLTDRGISVLRTGVNLDSYQPEDGHLGTLAGYKKNQSEWNRKHDLAAIEHIALLRRKHVRSIEDAKAAFVTADIGLAKYNYLECGHKAAATICEVLPDRLLTNLIWLKKPNVLTDIPLRAIIAMHSRDLFIDRNLWDAFHKTVVSLREKGVMTDEDTAILLYDNHLQEALLQEAEISEVTDPDWVLSRAQEAKARLDERQKEAVSREKKAILAKVSEIEQEKETAMLERIAEAKKSLSERTEIFADRVVNIIAVISCIAIAIVTIFLLPYVIRMWDKFAPIAWVLSVVGGIIMAILTACGWKFDLGLVRSRLQQWVFNRIYLKRLKESHLDSLPVLLVLEKKN